MRGAERVVFALGALGESGQAAALPERTNAVTPVGQDLVRIALVADVPDQLVSRRVEHIVQRHGKLDHAQARAEMAAGVGDRVDGLPPQLVGKLRELLGRQVLHVARQADAVEQRCLGRFWQEQLRNGRSGGKPEASPLPAGP
jgi:hypothetical protein